MDTSKEYRPEGWKVQKRTHGDWDNASERLKWNIPLDHGWAGGYEAGADALLKGLKKSGGMHRILERDDDYLARLYPGQTGYLVFIPEKE